jgi:hypothetical protein
MWPCSTLASYWDSDELFQLLTNKILVSGFVL